MTIFFSPFKSLFLYDDIGHGQLNMQLNKSEGVDDDDDGSEEEDRLGKEE